MTQEMTKNDGTKASNNGKQLALETDSDEGGHGSHYVVFHSIPDEDELLGIPRRRKTSSSGPTSSFVFNGWPRNASSDGGAEDSNEARGHQIDECIRGRSIQLMVWEYNRSNVVACKLQQPL